MQSNVMSTRSAVSELARYMPIAREFSGCPEGVIIPNAIEEEGTIAVVYDSRDVPPEITITVTEERIQTVLADGVAVAIVACSDGPYLKADDILLIERVVR